MTDKRIIETETIVAEKPPCKTAEEMEAVCCEEHGPLQCCERWEDWSGYEQDELKEKLGLNLDDKGRDSAGRYVSIIYKARTQPCGKEVTRYDTTPSDCCEGVPALENNEAITPKVVEKNGYAKVGVTGDVARNVPYVWKISGDGFYFGPNYAKDMVSMFPVVRIYTEDACGTGTITVSDDCSETTFTVRSEDGQWVDVPVDKCSTDYDGSSAEFVELGDNRKAYYEDDRGEYLIRFAVQLGSQISQDAVCRNADLSLRHEIWMHGEDFCLNHLDIDYDTPEWVWNLSGTLQKCEYEQFPVYYSFYAYDWVAWVKKWVC